MSHILLTGFTPFDGREFNASWIAARTLVAAHRSEHILHSLCVPVRWGQTLPALVRAIAQWQPKCIIAMGEGTAGLFKIETLARNQRALRKDNDNLLPAHPLINPQGPKTRTASAPYSALHSNLSQLGYPIQLSSDAGAYLCEELLYNLESLKEQYATLRTVLFVHLPPFGSTLKLHGKTQQCDERLLLEFSRHLLESLIALDLL